MPYWVYGVGFIALTIIIAAIKAGYQARVMVTVGLVVVMLFFALKKRR